jgi:hypothetical protein
MGPGSEETEETKGTQTESSGGAGRHPLPREDAEGKEDDPKVADRHEEATAALRDAGPAHLREDPPETTSGG